MRPVPYVSLHRSSDTQTHLSPNQAVTCIPMLQLLWPIFRRQRLRSQALKMSRVINLSKSKNDPTLTPEVCFRDKLVQP